MAKKQGTIKAWAITCEGYLFRDEIKEFECDNYYPFYKRRKDAYEALYKILGFKKENIVKVTDTVIMYNCSKWSWDNFKVVRVEIKILNK